MIKLNKHEMAWFHNNIAKLQYPEGSSVASEIWGRLGMSGLARLHEAIASRSVRKIQNLLDN